MRLPQTLRPFKQKVFGLTSDPKRLQAIRRKRRPDSGFLPIGNVGKRYAMWKHVSAAKTSLSRHSIIQVNFQPVAISEQREFSI